MNYLFGKAIYIKNKNDSSKNIFTQKDFSLERKTEEFAIQKNSYYKATIAFNNPLSTEGIIEAFSPIFADKTGELIRIIVKTSEDENAIALSMDYNSSFFVFGQGGYLNNISPNQTEIVFKNNLQYLKENEKTFQLFLKSGFFGDIDINIEERYDYLNKHKFENLGVFILVKGKSLESLLQNSNFFLTFLEEDA